MNRDPIAEAGACSSATTAMRTWSEARALHREASAHVASAGVSLASAAPSKSDWNNVAEQSRAAVRRLQLLIDIAEREAAK